jgi:hypothetical protein
MVDMPYVEFKQIYIYIYLFKLSKEQIQTNSSNKTLWVLNAVSMFIYPLNVFFIFFLFIQSFFLCKKKKSMKQKKKNELSNGQLTKQFC